MYIDIEQHWVNNECLLITSSIPINCDQVNLNISRQKTFSSNLQTYNHTLIILSYFINVLTEAKINGCKELKCLVANHDKFNSKVAYQCFQ